MMEKKQPSDSSEKESDLFCGWHFKCVSFLLDHLVSLLMQFGQMYHTAGSHAFLQSSLLCVSS